MSEVTTFSPIYFGVVVTVGVGDARLICMAQEDNRSLNIHFLQVDSTLDDAQYKVAVFEKRDFQSELRGTSLAVRLIENAGFGEAKATISKCLTEAYGADAQFEVKQIEKPSILSLFS